MSKESWEAEEISLEQRQAEIREVMETVRASMKPLYRFTGVCVIGSNIRDRRTPWDQGKALSVLAGTKDQAVNKAHEMLGKTGTEHLGDGMSWKIRFDSIEEVQP